MTEDRKPTTREKRNAAERVREAARDLFYRQGIHATGVEELCRVAGTTKMGLYRSFPSKDALVEALLEEQCESGEALYAETMALPDPRQRPWHYVEQAAALLRSPGFRACPMAIVTVEFPDPDHAVRKLIDGYRQVKRDRLRKMCAEAGAPEALGDTLLLLLEGAFTSAAYLGNEAAAESLEQAARALLTEAYGPREGAPAA
ncbi:TetR/AcrR family transcriptional regulator [Siccirubricoccus phaeus]|uniref:TetR/AcrR family transcriptional regulator n=1 Tax=Siccirubricoccus phaeus TaxID=2595053 RepID=UPI0011F32E4C|nr:TetR/AcrR family transcriptional regulator [Siccirubricoccus phaeus]